MARGRRGKLRAPVTAPPPPGIDAAAIAAALDPWFRANAREMTWRKTRDPYAIWVSEVMLQQTRVETVERYYADFMARFPDVGALAAADEHDVLQQWSGLGYYRRAKLLHRGAKVVAERFAARMPEDAETLREIPGIGPYTAGAIASIAFDRPEPLVDGNVARVLSRLAAIEDPKQQAAGARGHWQVVAEILRHGPPRVLAQALMELGATVCTPVGPRCLLCPVRAQCRASAEGRVDEIPAVVVRGELPIERWWALLVRAGERRLFVRRPAEGLLADLWCVPLVARTDAKLSVAVVRALLGPGARVIAERGDVVHVFTHRRWELRTVEVAVDREVLPAGIEQGRVCWAAAEEAPRGGVPTLTRKLWGAG